MDYFEHWFSWLLLIIIIISVAYTAFVIKKEKSIYIQSAVSYRLGQLIIKVPTWWGHEKNNQKDPTEYKFTRKDTYYDWWCKITYVPKLDFRDNKTNLITLESCLDKIIEEQQIILDPEESSLQKKQITYKNSNKAYELLRIESTGTQGQEQRIYLDIAIIREKSNGTDMTFEDCYILQSQSSILNGGIEGPYFEEMLNSLEMVSK